MIPGIFIAFLDSKGKVDNAWFYSPLDCVRWLRAFTNRVEHIIVLREG